MVSIFFKQIYQTLLVVTALALILAQPLWADENPENTPKISQEEESVFQTFKRKSRTWFKSDTPTENVQKETPEPVEKKPQEETTSQKSDGSKAIDKFKNEMNKISDNISESVERDKKTLKKKIDKLFEKE